MKILIPLFKPYLALVIWLLFFALLTNALNLAIPKVIQTAIDDLNGGTLRVKVIAAQFAGLILSIFILGLFQSIIQSLVSERIARDLRSTLAEKVSQQSYLFIQNETTQKLLTNFTSDVDAIKMFVSQAVISIVSSVMLVIGASVLLLSINWKLGLIVLAMVPIIAIAFYLVFSRMKGLFLRSQQIVDRLTRVITENMIGVALIRVLNAQAYECDKFLEVSTQAKGVGLSILRLFTILVPFIVLLSNIGRLTVLQVGGTSVMSGNMTLGEFAAFNSYISVLIFPILVIGFMSNVIARATASYSRICSIIRSPDTVHNGSVAKTLTGEIKIDKVTVKYGEKFALKDISCIIKAGSRTAIVGPTAAGKTQLFYALTTLIKPEKGDIYYDGIIIEDYDRQALLSQIGLAFQDSIIFNMSLRENIAFNGNVSSEVMQKVIATAELEEFISSLPDGVETKVSERGSTLSGGQKQRIMLARALTIEPKILLLDDFTARVDERTEQKIMANLRQNYPDLTLVTITQKIGHVQDFDQILFLMQGELIAAGKHEHLMATSIEYAQIDRSQQSLYRASHP